MRQESFYERVALTAALLVCRQADKTPIIKPDRAHINASLKRWWWRISTSKR